MVHVTTNEMPDISKIFQCFFGRFLDERRGAAGDSPSAVQLFRGSVQSVQAVVPPVDTGVVPSASSASTVSAAAASSTTTTSRPSATFIADYTVRALTDVTYFRVSRSLYQVHFLSLCLPIYLSIYLFTTCSVSSDSKADVNHVTISVDDAGGAQRDAAGTR